MRRSAMWVVVAALAVACTGDTVGPTQDEAVPPPLAAKQGPKLRLASAPVCLDEAITCVGAECELARQIQSAAECSPGKAADILPNGKVMPGKGKGLSAILGQRAYDLACAVGLVPEPLYAAQEEVYFGVRDAQNMSGQGTVKKCEAKLHVCFRSGNLDDVLSGAFSEATCRLACNRAVSPNQIACSWESCVSRCVVARVTGSGDCT